MSIKTLCNVELEGGSRIIGQTIVLGSASGLINRTASQLASDGTDSVYVGSNNYGWNDARDWATQTVNTVDKVLSYNDQFCGIICPVNLSQVSIVSQLRINSANASAQCVVYKGDRRDTTGDITLTEILSTGQISTSNSKFTSMDRVGTVSVDAGQLIIVGFGKTDTGAGQKPRFNFTLTGTTA